MSLNLRARLRSRNGYFVKKKSTNPVEIAISIRPPTLPSSSNTETTIRSCKPPWLHIIRNRSRITSLPLRLSVLKLKASLFWSNYPVRIRFTYSTSRLLGNIAESMISTLCSPKNILSTVNPLCFYSGSIYITLKVCSFI